MIYYLCAPYAEDAHHTIKRHKSIVNKIAKKIKNEDEEKIILVPHNMFPVEIDDSNRVEIMNLQKFIISNYIDALIVAGDRLSAGMGEEIEIAQNNNKKIIWYNPALKGMYALAKEYKMFMS